MNANDLNKQVSALENAVYGVDLANIPADTLEKTNALVSEVEGDIDWLTNKADELYSLISYIKRLQKQEQS